MIGGGLVIERGLYGSDSDIERLGIVRAGETFVRPVPDWVMSRPNSTFQMTRGTRAYAVLPLPAKNVSCTQRVEVIAADGTSCGHSDYPIAPGTCDTNALTVGVDGTVIQALPRTMEASEEVIIGTLHTCRWRWWSGVLR